MFTGIVEETGQVISVSTAPSGGGRLRIRCRTVLEDAFEGSSIAVNGVCLTAVDLEPDSFAADMAPETLRRTNLGSLTAGARVNLERPVAANGRLSGHIVQGHVDGTGEVISFEPLGDGNFWLKVRVPAELDRFLVFKGSIALDGVSLTIATLEQAVIGITIIPHTVEATCLSIYEPGKQVNIECDILAKHVERLMALRADSLSV